MRILFHKVSNERHQLEIVREEGARERVDCETRSYLQHDLLHYALETEASLTGGFWGSLAGGKTLSELNDRSGRTMHEATPELMMIERVVGVLSGVVKGRSPAELVAGLRDGAASSESEFPDWLTARLVAAVQERMRQLMGHWNATKFGSAMELAWPARGRPG